MNNCINCDVELAEDATSTLCLECTKTVYCYDCGEVGVIIGHMTCAFPQNHDENEGVIDTTNEPWGYGQ